MTQFVDQFCRPLLEGGEVRLALPLDDAHYAALASTGLDPWCRAALHLRARAVWAHCPAPSPRLVSVFAAMHDLLVGLHPSSGRVAPGSGYLAALADRVRARDAALPRTPAWLVYRWAVADAALTLTREDTFVDFKLLGRVAGYGQAPEYWDLPWRVVDRERRETTTASETFGGGLLDPLATVSPMAAVALCARAGRPLPTGAAEPLFHHPALARWLVRCLSETPRGRAALVRTFGETPWPDAAALRRWLGLALYIAHVHPDADDDPDWRALVASLAPFAGALGSPPIDGHGQPLRWHRGLIRRARLESP